MSIKFKDELDLLKKEVLSDNHKVSSNAEVIDEEGPVDIEEMAQENDASKKVALNRPGKREAFIVYYKLNNKSNVEKVQFSFALTGRTNQIGILQKMKGKKLGRGCLLVPAMNLKQIQEFFTFWNVGISTQKILLME